MNTITNGGILTNLVSAKIVSIINSEDGTLKAHWRDLMLGSIRLPYICCQPWDAISTDGILQFRRAVWAGVPRTNASVATRGLSVSNCISILRNATRFLRAHKMDIINGSAYKMWPQGKKVGVSEKHPSLSSEK